MLNVKLWQHEICFAPFQSGKGAIAFIRECLAHHAQLSHFGLHKSNQTLTTYLWTSKTIRLDECLGDYALTELPTCARASRARAQFTTCSIPRDSVVLISSVGDR